MHTVCIENKFCSIGTVKKEKNSHNFSGYRDGETFSTTTYYYFILLEDDASVRSVVPTCSG